MDESMDDRELESRLRAARRQVPAPPRLHRFAASVPGQHPREPGWRRAVGVLRGGMFATSAAAAIVVAVAGGVALMGWRSQAGASASPGASSPLAAVASGAPSATTSGSPSATGSGTPSSAAPGTPTPTAVPTSTTVPTPTPSATPVPSPDASFSQRGVTWTKLGKPGSVWYEAMPGGGYVATSVSCWDETVPVVYTSPDGITWTTPPDPHIFASADEGFCLTIHEPAAGPGGYLLAGRVSDGMTMIWQSSDGIHWQRRAVPSLEGAELSEISSTHEGYLAADGGHDRYWTSRDGVVWTAASSTAFKLRSGASGEPIFAGGEGMYAWFSLDGGRTWARTGTPTGMKSLQGVARLGKLYYGNWSIGATMLVYSSPDLRRWTQTPAPGRMSGSLVAFGNRLYVLNYDDTLMGDVYSSADGRTWAPVKDAAGHAIRANALRVSGGRLFVLDGAINWVAAPA